MLFNLTVRQRMLGLSLLGLSFVLAVSGVGYRALQQMSEASELQSAASSALRSQMEADMMHDTLRSDVLGAVLAANKGQTEELASLNRELAEHAASFTQQMETLAGMAISPEITASVQKSQERLRAYAASARAVVALAGSDLPAAEAQLPGFAKNFKLLETEMSALSDLIEAHEKTTRETAAADAHRARITVLATTVLALALLLSINMWVGRGITRPLQAAVRATQAVARGDLTVVLDIRGSDETAQLLQALQSMSGQLAAMVGEVRASADAIRDGSTEIADGSLSLSQRTEEQASSLEQTSAAMETMTATVRQNADTAEAATRLAQDASSGAAAGGQAVERVVMTMEDISRSSSRIADIIGVIDGIAFQTNILALNAAVEAARAGEQGRGFAVVAGEVRLLAQRSAQAAKEIKSLIEESVTQVRHGSQQVADAGGTVQAVVSQVERVARLIADIHHASREQADGIGQVGSAVSVLDQMTQQNAALVEETAASAESLKQQADRLAGLMHRFKLSD